MENSHDSLSSHAIIAPDNVRVPELSNNAPRDDADIDVAESMRPSTTPIERCDACKLAITLRCAELMTEGKLRGHASSDHDSRELLRGARAGCRDCCLILSILEHYQYDENGSFTVNLGFDVMISVKRAPQLRIRMHARNGTVDKYSTFLHCHIFRSPGHAHPVHSANAFIYERSAIASVEAQWRNIEQRQNLPRDTSSEQAFSTLKGWLHDCLQTHERCSKSNAAHLPKRILEISATKVYLREDLDRSAMYACLSHCWGKEGAALQLTSHTVDGFKGGISRAHLPRTFRDAVDICEKLDIQFLWIDAMCILQDNLDDWASTAQAMASIYESAYLTIAATGSNNSHGGCFSRPREEYQDVRLGNTGLCARKQLPIFPGAWLSKLDETEWPLLERSWVCQERRLSTRVIHFAKDQIFWECNSAFRSGCGLEDIVYRSSARHNRIPIRDVLDDRGSGWRELITTYSVMKFTKSRDRLPALAGIVEREGRHRKDDLYVAGMWKSTLLEDLGFYGTGNCDFAPDVPTWSWAYLRNGVFFSPIMNLTPTTQLVGLDFIPNGPSNMGDVISASIRLEGPTLSISVKAYLSGETTPILDNDTDQLLIMFIFNKSYGNLDPNNGLLLLLMSASTDPSRILDAYCQIKVLVLQEIPNGKYKRLGSGELRYNRKDMQHADWRKIDPKRDEENMERLLALFTVREVEVV